MKYQVELVVDHKAILGEGPSWDANKKVLYWVNIMEGEVHIFDPNMNENRTINVGQYVGAAVPRKSGGLLLALQNGFYSLDLQTEELTAITDPEKNLPNNRFNDGKCDVSGRFWAGTMPLDGEQGAGSLYCLDVDHTVKTKITDVTISNGITWSPDKRTMYYIDTPTHQVVAYDFNVEHGTISNKRVVVKIPHNMGGPDGMTADNEGMLWIAKWGGFMVGRWNPYTGELIDSIQIPAPNVTSCAFGGKNLNDLYVTTAREGLSEEILEKYPHAGGLFRIKTDVKGLKTYPFGN